MSWCEICEGEKPDKCSELDMKKYNCPYLKQGTRDTLNPAEPHPAARSAMDYIRTIPYTDLVLYQEAFATNAIEGNRLAEICLGTINRLLHSEPVSDRYLLGLAWTLMEMRQQNETT